MKSSSAILSYVICFLTGLYLAHGSWSGVDFVFLSGLRLPASFHGGSAHFPSEYQSSSQNELKRTEGGFEVYLNQFVVRDKKDLKSFVCEAEGRLGVFDRVELKLVGMGISEAGRTPQLYVESDCRSQAGSAKVGPIRVFVPMAEIMKLKPTDQEIRWDDGDNILIRIVEMVSEWPQEWRLESVTYKNRHDSNYTLTLSLPVKESPSQRRAFTLFWPESEESQNH